MADFPVPFKIPLLELASKICHDSCDVTAMGLFLDKQVNKEDGDTHKTDDKIDLGEVYSFISKTKFGTALKSGSFEEKIFTYFQKNFFGGSPFDGAHAIFSPLAISIEKCNDGDTCKISTPAKLSVRLDGIDTPESFRGMPQQGGGWRPNPKLDVFRRHIWLYWKEKYKFGANIEKTLTHLNELVAGGSDGKKVDAAWQKISAATESDDRNLMKMIEDRIAYEGLIAGSVTKGLVNWVTSNHGTFSLDLSFTRSSTDPAMCNTFEPVDTYDRSLGRIRINPPSSSGDTNILAYFIATELHKIMQKDGKKYYDFFHNGKAPSESNDWAKPPPAALTEWGQKALRSTNSKEIWQALSPETLPKPWELFTEEKCKKLAAEWIQFSKNHPEYKNDMQAMLVFLGVAYAYPKYRNQFTDAYLFAEDGAMKCAHGENNELHGLYNDPLFIMMQPNEQRSPIFNRFKDSLSRGKNLLPRDCCDVLKEKNGDIYGHCIK